MLAHNHFPGGRRPSNRTGYGGRRAPGLTRAAAPAVLTAALAAQLGFASRKPHGIRARAARWNNIIVRRLTARAERGSL